MSHPELTPDEYQIVLKHLTHKAAIENVIQIRTHLIDQFQQLKLDDDTGEVADPLAKQYFGNYLFLGNERNTGYDPLPCAMEGQLEEVLKKELKHDTFYYPDVYYNWPGPAFAKEKEALKTFKPEQWNIDEGLEMTSKDIETLHRFRDLMFQLFEDVIRVIGKDYEPVEVICNEFERIKRLDGIMTGREWGSDGTLGEGVVWVGAETIGCYLLERCVLYNK